MQSARADDTALSDDESLFGSPPPSPDGNCQPEPAQPRLSLTQLPSSSHSESLSSPSFRPPPTASLTVGKKKSSRETSTTPRPDQPLIKLPDPNAPLPPNFLRNQQALLGLAGMVGGVNPANLSLQRHTRGTNAQNPIIVEDEHDPPRLGLHYGPRHPLINHSQLPTPSSAQILSTLVNQKNIFPVLESILKLLGSDPSPPSCAATETPSSVSDGPPTKRRRMSEVPAGAADWDAPYPFPSGEGPSNYQSDWSKQRGTQLISQLIALIRSAANKAATKSYAQKQNPYQSLDNVNGHYRPVTAAYGGSSQPSHSPYQLPATPPRLSSSSLDQLVSSMFGPDSRPPAPPNTSSIELSHLEGLISLLDDAISEQGRPEPSSPSANLMFLSDSPTIPDSLIDPVLLRLSIPSLEQFGTSSSSSIAGGSTPALADSPIPSNSSVTDPVTPNYDVPISPEPEVASGDAVSGWGVSDTRVNWGGAVTQRLLDSSSSSPAFVLTPPSNVPPSCDVQTMPTSTTPNCFDLKRIPATTQNTAIPIASTSIIPIQPSQLRLKQAPAMRTPTSNASRPTTSMSATATRQRREQLIQRAKEMRRQLVGEIGKSKVELWELTIEQGVLAQLAKDNAL